MSNPSAQWLHSPLAIVGMACRLPGADGLEPFWNLLERGGYAIQRMPDHKLDRRLYFDERKSVRGKTYSQIGGFVDERELDWSLLNITPEQAGDWDLCHLSLCEVAARACVHAGYDPRNLPHRNVGVFVGHSGGTTLGGDLAYRTLLEDYLKLLAEMPEWQSVGSPMLMAKLRSELAEVRPMRRDGGRPFVDAGFASGVISHNFGLTGPHMSIDAACASSLVALALGAMSLASGQTEMAIIGGASYNKADSLVLFSAAQSCSSQMSRPFDQAADGLISAEGYVTVLIKRLDRAIADGDRVHAVIRGIGYSSDGRGRSLWAPRHEGQATAIQRAYPDDIQPSSVQLIEAHATSTQVGDATEMEALTTFYAPKLEPGQRLPVGSVKSNIGHTLETAGLAGLIKAVLAIQHGVIPPSINLQNPNETIPWDSVPFYVPKSAQPWPTLAPNQPRRAAVNAFGIGGLNVHVVVDQALNLPARATQNASETTARNFKSLRSEQASVEPIAIVGRGLVIPGANSLQAWEALLSQSTAQNVAQTEHLLASWTHRVDFVYDWRKHKVPPKQVAHANPLQFMLLEAAEQALNEANLMNEAFDRAKTAVVVGSIFGGDFGNSLFAGLRLPEFCDKLAKTIAQTGIAAAQADLIIEKYVEQFLKQYPALLDETGSFTSSTLASRISKTFNLMGGAMAIDAGDVSGLAALKTSCWLLQSGSANSVLCAAAQRALDRAALDNLQKCGRLRGFYPNGDHEGYSLGEGVALVVLKRHSDAKRDGDKILGIIDSIGMGFDNRSLAQSVRVASESTGQSIDSASKLVGRLGVSALDQQAAQLFDTAEHRLEISPNVPITGHLQGAQGLVDVITCSLDKQHARQVILGHTLSGQSALVRLTIPDAVSPTHLTDDRVSDVQRMNRNENRIESAPRIQTPAMPTNTFSTQFAQPTDSSFTASEVWHRLGLEIRYWSADTLEGLKSAAASDNLKLVTQVPTAGRFVATVVALIDQSAIKARKLAALIGQPQTIDQLIDQGIWWVDRSSLATRPPRIAFAFSGQGSQYAGMLSGLPAAFPVAGQLIQRADEALRTVDGSTFAGMAWASDNQLGENVWQTQASLLIADSMLSAVIQSLPINPEVVFGHSYGEIPAMLAAGSLDLETAVRLTWHRCQSVTLNAPTGCSMLSIQADEKTVANAIVDYHLPLTISHVNAPQQTVVGGKHSQIAQLAAILDDSGVASRVLPVPTAFHTPALQAAVEPFRSALRSLPIQPPRLPLLSSVNNCFMADPDLIRDGLAEQLVTPLRFVSLLEKLAAQGITHVVEVGPQRVLTRLARACGTGIQVFSSDFGPQGENSPQGFLPLALLHVFSQITAGFVSSGQRLNASAASFVAATANSVDSATAPSAVKTFDATAARRQRMRSQSAHNRGMGSIAAPAAPMTSVPSPVIPAPAPILSQAAAQPTPIAPTTPVQSLVQASSIDVPATAEVEQILIDFVVEQTGYPAEIVELDADLEADLGIDSIKKAQLLGELRELFPQAMAAMQSTKSGTTNDVRAQGNRLASLRTLRDFVNLLAPQPSTTSAASTSTSTAKPAAPIVQPLTQVPAAAIQTNLQTAYSPIAPVSPATPIAHPPIPQAQSTLSSQPTTNTQPAISRKSLEQFVIDFVVEQTGYPAEIVELDADLEADLGIDSIKKAQLLGELRETFALKLGGANDASGTQTKSKSGLDQLRTLNQILDLLAAQVGCVNDATVQNAVVPAVLTAPVPLVEVATAALVAPAAPPQVHVALDQSIETIETAQRSSSQRNLPTYHADHKNGFADAVRLNLRALPARQVESFNLSLISKIEESPSLKSAAQVLAQHADVCENSLVAFDQEIVSKSTWRLINPQMQPSTASTRFLLELSLPNWLTEGRFQPLGVKHLPGGQIELLTPGAITPMVLIDAKNNLYAVGSSSTDGKLELSAKLRMLAEIEPNQLSTTLRSWEQPADWWLLVVDVQRSQVMHFQRHNQIFSHSQCHLNRWSENEGMGSGVWARVGFDCDSQQWIADTKSGPLNRAERMIIKSSLSLSQNEVAECSATATVAAAATVRVLDRDQPEDVANCEPVFFESQFLTAFSTQELNDSFQSDDVVEKSVSVSSLVAETTEPAIIESSAIENAVPENSTKIAQRYILRMAPAPQIEVPGRQPTWSGKAIVVGNNPIADQLESRLRASGVDVVRMIANGVASETALAEQFVALAQHEKLPHLFITSPCDADAKLSLDRAAWNTRRNAGLMSIFWLCQKWVDHVTSLNITDDASLIAVSSLGGDFGISGGVHSAEGGGINGLLKSILIESWMQGYRSLPIKTIDTDPSQSPAEIVNNIYRELAVSSYDNEISYKGGVRQILKAIPLIAKSVDSKGKLQAANDTRKVPLRPLTRGGAWVCTGGARGITALVAERLAKRYGITLHLLGTAPAPNLDASWRDLDSEGLRQLKLQVMTDARKLGVNPVKHWQDTEKQMEIDATLRRLHSLGIKAYYHSCDVANRPQLAEVINQIRAISGPIRGVVHGAGVGRDSRFDRKQPEKVAQCISAKVDGALALMEATWNDPLEAFVGFGSISGRFGANGHTDYSLANEMLCKQIDWLKRQRPEVRAIGFHWHAWGDVGMATKPETKLALEMIHMQFMPAEEGIEHLITELESDAGESEVLITDDRYYRAFYPAETLVESSENAGSQIATPMLEEVATTGPQRKWTAKVDPVKDPFLAEHLLDGKPLLPFVVASEMMYEAAAAALNSSQIVLREIQAHGAVRFFSEGIQELTLASTVVNDGRASIELRSDFVSRKGVVVDRDRLNFSAKAALSAEPLTKTLRGSVQLPIDGNVSWQSVHYPPADAEFYVGWPLQKLRKVALTSEGLLGKISAPALIELAGVTRSTQGWRVPSAALDACLFAVGILAWQRIAPGSALPVRMGQLQLGRLPSPGESLTIHAVMNSSSEGVASFDFSLYGVDGAMILDVADYEVAWLGRTQAGVDQAAEQERG